MMGSGVEVIGLLEFPLDLFNSDQSTRLIVLDLRDREKKRGIYISFGFF